MIAIAAEGDKDVARLADDVIYVPAVEEFLSPLVNIIPLQLLAYHIAVLRGCNVHRPSEPGQKRDGGIVAATSGRVLWFPFVSSFTLG